MADEQLTTETNLPLSDLKRKLDDPDTNPNSNSLPDSDLVTVPDESEPKRPRLDDLATVNGHQEEKVDEPKEEADGEPTEENNTLSEDAQQPADEATEMGNDEKSAVESQQTGDIQQPSDEKPQLENPQEELSKGEVKESSLELQESLAEVVPQQGDVSSAEQPTSGAQPMTRRMEIANTKVGVLIGKAGDTIRYLQYNSGAKIQITRDVEADPNAPTRPVEIIGTLENIIKAEKLIKDVIAEADAGGSPSLVARGFNSVQSPGGGEQIEIQVPNEKVGSIIGKGGETIKNLQTRSGARIQLIPQHLPEGDQSRERTVRVTGDKKQIEVAKEMIKEVMNQPPIRRSPLSGNYNQQGFRPRGPSGSQWGPRGHNQSRPTGYNNPQRGPHPSHNQQYQSPSYGNYPPQQQAPPRGNFGWDQRPPQSTMQAPPPQGGYDYYGGPNNNVPGPQQHHPHGPSVHAMGPPPSHNYGQQQGQDYGQQTQYSQNAPPAQTYGHGYPEAKYENQAPQQLPYGGPQPSAYPQGTTQQGYGTQEQYGKPPPYGIAPQGPHAQPYSQPRAIQPGEMPYAGQAQPTQSYGPNAPAQQTYPYAASGPTQQAYPQYGSDGYTLQQPATVSGPTGYAQPTGQPVSGYGQPVGQQAPGYAQVGPTGNYGPQPGYTEQAAPNNPGYGYQGPTDQAYAAGPGSAYIAPAGQPVYSQPAQAQAQAQAQPGYDQSVQQPGAYGNVPAGYVKGASPQPGYAHYDPSQMYGAQR